MKKQIPIKYFLLADLFLASLMACYWLSAGAGTLRSFAVFLSILFSGSPLAMYFISTLVGKRAAATAKNQSFDLKSSHVLEQLASVDTIILGRNEIIMENKPYISDIFPEGMTKATLLGLAGSAERDSTHPVGKLIYETALLRGLRLQRVSAANEIPRCGTEVIISGSPVRVGKLSWIQEEEINVSAELLTKQDQFSCHGKSSVFVCNGKYARGIIATADNILPDNKEAVHFLHRLGYSTILFTSDNQRIASFLQKASCIHDVKPNLTPSTKAREIQLLRTKGNMIAFVGNSESDDLAFTEADVSIKLLPKNSAEDLRTPDLSALLQEEFAGEESASKKETSPKVSSYAADITLHGNLQTLIPVLQLARNAKTIIQQNRMIACVHWLIFLPLSMGLLTVFGGPFLDPSIAFAGIVLAALLVLLNSMRMN